MCLFTREDKIVEILEGIRRNFHECYFFAEIKVYIHNIC